MEQKDENIYIGIDPSINSTGITVLKFKGDKYVTDEYFFIIKPNKLTKKEQAAEDRCRHSEDNLSHFQYILYHKEDVKADDDYEYRENCKTFNMIEIIRNIEYILEDKEICDGKHIYVVMEGVSYGSTTRTQSVFDLAGLNYLIRFVLMHKDNVTLHIGSPSEIKKYASGAGNNTKDITNEMFKSTHKWLEPLPKIDDISDSYWMAIYAKYIKENR